MLLLLPFHGSHVISLWLCCLLLSSSVPLLPSLQILSLQAEEVARETKVEEYERELARARRKLKQLKMEVRRAQGKVEEAGERTIPLEESISQSYEEILQVGMSLYVPLWLWTQLIVLRNDCYRSTGLMTAFRQAGLSCIQSIIQSCSFEKGQWSQKTAYMPWAMVTRESIQESIQGWKAH